jgi:hypothetical protein
MVQVFVPHRDPTGTLRVEVDREHGTVALREDGRCRRFCLEEGEPGALGWRERNDGCEAGGNRSVSVAVVLACCAGEWEAEQEVAEMTRMAALRASLRGGQEWQRAARRLRGQLRGATRTRRVPTLLFRKWWEHLSDERRSEPLSASEAARRGGYVVRGCADTGALHVRLGLRPDHSDRPPAAMHTVSHETGLRLCRALGRDPVDVGL